MKNMVQISAYSLILASYATAMHSHDFPETPDVTYLAKKTLFFRENPSFSTRKKKQDYSIKGLPKKILKAFTLYSLFTLGKGNDTRIDSNFLERRMENMFSLPGLSLVLNNTQFPEPLFLGENINQRFLSPLNLVIPDTLINTYTTGNQSYPSITTLNDGGFLITWQSDGQDGNGSGIYAQRYNADGTTYGAEFKVNTYTTGNQSYPSVTALKDGGFLMSWSSNGQDGNASGIYAQRYNADGTTYGTEFRVNTYTTGNQSYPSVTALKDGGFLISWQSDGQDGSGYGVYTQRYNADGTTYGAEFRVNTYITNHQTLPSVTTLNDGGFLISWSSNGQDGSAYGVYAQRYNADGTTYGTEFKVNTYTNSDQTVPSVTALKDGGFLISWQSDGQDGSGYGVYTQRYNADGTTYGAEFRVNTYTNSDQTVPSVTTLNDGGFLISWSSNGQDGNGSGIYAQRYNADGTTYGTEFKVNTYTNSDQTVPSVASLNDGGFVIAWQSHNKDGDGYGIFAKRYDSRGINVPMEHTVCYPFNSLCSRSPYQIYDNSTEAIFNLTTQEVLPLGLLNQTISNYEKNYTDTIEYYENLLKDYKNLASINTSLIEEKGLNIAASLTNVFSAEEVEDGVLNSLQKFGYDSAVMAGSFLYLASYVALQKEVMDITGNLYNKKTGTFTVNLKDYYEFISNLASVYWVVNPMVLYFKSQEGEFTSDYKNLFDQYAQPALFLLIYSIAENKRWSPFKKCMESRFSSQSILIDRIRNTFIDMSTILMASAIQTALPSNKKNSFGQNLVSNISYYIGSYVFGETVQEWVKDKTVGLLTFFYNPNRSHYIQWTRDGEKTNCYYLSDEQLRKKLIEDARNTLLSLALLRWGNFEKSYVISKSTKYALEKSIPLQVISKIPESEHTPEINYSQENDNSFLSLIRPRIKRLDYPQYSPICLIDEDTHELSLRDSNTREILPLKADNSLVFNHTRKNLYIVDDEANKKSLEISIYEYHKKKEGSFDKKNIISRKTNFPPSTIESTDDIMSMKNYLWNNAQKTEKASRHSHIAQSLRLETEYCIEMEKNQFVPSMPFSDVILDSIKTNIFKLFGKDLLTRKIYQKKEYVGNDDTLYFVAPANLSSPPR